MMIAFFEDVTASTAVGGLADKVVEDDFDNIFRWPSINLYLSFILQFFFIVVSQKFTLSRKDDGDTANYVFDTSPLLLRFFSTNIHVKKKIIVYE